MKLEDLDTIHARVDRSLNFDYLEYAVALEQRLAYAKELLLTYGQPGVWKNIEAFIEKLNSEGL